MGSRLGLYHTIQQTDFWDAVVLIGVNPGIQSEKSAVKEENSTRSFLRKSVNMGLLGFWITEELPLIKTQSKAPDDFYRAMHERKKSLKAKDCKTVSRIWARCFPDLWGEIQSIQSLYF